MSLAVFLLLLVRAKSLVRLSNLTACFPHTFLIILLLDMGCSKKTSIPLGTDHGTRRNHNVGRNSCPHNDRTHSHPYEVLDSGTVNHGPECKEAFFPDDTRPVDDNTPWAMEAFGPILTDVPPIE